MANNNSNDNTNNNNADVKAEAITDNDDSVAQDSSTEATVNTGSSDEAKTKLEADSEEGNSEEGDSEKGNSDNGHDKGSILASFIDKATKASVEKLRRKKNKSVMDEILGRNSNSALPDGDVLNNDVLNNLGNQSADTANAPRLRLAFLGGGSFGTAMANLAARNGCDSTLWVRNKRTVKSLQKNRVNKKYLPKYTLDSTLKFEHDLQQAVSNKDIIFVAVPSGAFRETLQKIKPYITGQAIVSLTKGMEKDTFALMSDIITDELLEVNFGVMSGPNLAVEIMENMPSATVIASESEPLRHAVQLALHSAFFRVFAADDVRGVELGGALKNIYAIAMGMAGAYNVGENTKAMILTRALAEMSRFGVASGANPLTFLGLAGVGDLYATCSSELSRNYRIGNMLGKGITLENAIKKLGQTAEGVNTIQQVHEKAVKEDIYMPITHALYAVIYEDQAALGVALNLMEAGFRSDVEFVMPHDQSNDSLNAQISASADDRAIEE